MIGFNQRHDQRGGDQTEGDQDEEAGNDEDEIVNDVPVARCIVKSGGQLDADIEDIRGTQEIGAAGNIGRLLEACR